MWFSSEYSLRKSRSIFKRTLHRLTKTDLSKETKEEGRRLLLELEAAFTAKNRQQASALAIKAENWSQRHLKRNLLVVTLEGVAAVVIAILLAVVIRQMWFELYEIPTGSMRPTYREQDHLAVTKTAFGLNVPMQTRHFYFDPALVRRGEVFILSAENLPNTEHEIRYLGLIPYTKRFIKRCLGLPGDTLYFYGGKLYGFSADGEPIVAFPQKEVTDGRDLEYIPFLTFEGKVDVPSQKELVTYQMGLPIGRFLQSGTKSPFQSPFVGQFYNGHSWEKDLKKQTSDKVPTTFSSLYGIDNFAKARLLTQTQALSRYKKEDLPKEAPYYLEIAHHPHFPLRLHEVLGNRLFLYTHETSLLPLDEKHLERLSENLYTARFNVTNGKASRYQIERSPKDNFPLPQLADGRYEFYDGKLSSVIFGGYLRQESLPPNFMTNERLAFFYNEGVDFSKIFDPETEDALFPHRYVYFRDGAFFALGAPLMDKDDPNLALFVKKEREKAALQSAYSAFIDAGPPPQKPEFFNHFGLKIPEKRYLALGDNHAMSGDSRVFGLVPEANLQGAPTFLLWPPGTRWGFISDGMTPFFNFPGTVVWLGVGAFASMYGLWHHQRKKREEKFLRG